MSVTFSHHCHLFTHCYVKMIIFFFCIISSYSGGSQCLFKLNSSVFNSKFSFAHSAAFPTQPANQPPFPHFFSSSYNFLKTYFRVNVLSLSNQSTKQRPLKFSFVSFVSPFSIVFLLHPECNSPSPFPSRSLSDILKELYRF